MKENNKDKGLVWYDLESLPNSLNVDEMIYIMKRFNIIFWDSTEGGVKPDISNPFDEDKIILDYSTEEGKSKLEEINKIIKDGRE